jgi:hypothetical protein
MLKCLIIALLLSASPQQVLPADMTAQDLANIERVTISNAGVQIDYNEDYCVNNDLDYRGYWIEFERDRD